MKKYCIRTLMIALAIPFCLCGTVILYMNTGVMSALAANRTENKKITVVFNDGEIDASKYLPEAIEADDVTWEINQKAIAAISPEGLITPLKLGTIKVAAKNSKNAKVLQLTVTITSSNVGIKTLFDESQLAPALQETDSASFYTTSKHIKNPEYYKKVVTNVSELSAFLINMQFEYGGNYYYCENGWSTSLGAELSLWYGGGVCEDVAEVASYLLQNDYDDIGYILVNGMYAHMYNYILQDDIYYVVDFTQLICNTDAMYNGKWNKWTKKAVIWSGRNIADFSKKAKEYADYDNDDYTLEESVSSIVAFSSHNKGYRTPQFRNDGWGYYTISDRVLGFEEGVKYTILYLNPTDHYKNATYRIVEIPAKYIPYDFDCYFDTETKEEKYQRQTQYEVGLEEAVNYGNNPFSSPNNREILTAWKLTIGAELEDYLSD